VSEALGINFEEINRAGVVTRPPIPTKRAQPRNVRCVDRLLPALRPAAYLRRGDAIGAPDRARAAATLRLHGLGEQGALQTIREFYRAAYTHVWTLENFIRPNVPLINGLAFGGVGIAAWHPCVAAEAISTFVRKSASASSPISAARIFFRACSARSAPISR
jgi:enoyl-CoA hydratase